MADFPDFGDAAAATTSLNASGLAKDTSVTAVKTSTDQVNTTLGTPAQDSIRTAIPTNISTTGVPVLVKPTKLASGTSTAIGANAAVTLNGGTQITLTQPTVDIFVTLKYSSVNGASPYASVQIAWFDSTGNNQVWYDAAVALIGDKTAAFTTQIRVPARGFFFNVIVDNLDSQAITCTWEVEASSFPAPDLDVRWAIPAPATNPPGITFPSGLYPDSKVVAAHVNTALAHSATDTITLPPCPGRIWFSFWEQGVTAANMSVRLDATPPTYYTGTSSAAFLIDDLPVAGNPVKMAVLLNGAAGPIRARVANNDATLAANYVFTLTRE